MAVNAEAQINEIGIFAGGSNYVGDVGPTTYIAPNDLAFGVLYKWNRSPRHAYRFSYTHAEISSKDADSEVRGRKEREYAFDNTISELSAGLEFNFFDFNLHEDELKITPYVYSGISYFWYNEKYTNNNILRTEEKKKGSIAIPMTLGIKTNIVPNFIIGIEASARYTFTDNLDGSNPDNEDIGVLRFGNLESNDWYMFTGITLTYTFGVKPCYCAD